jgi:hypothetical protein
MPSNTYVALDTRTLSSAASSVTFTGIDQTYTDLVLISSINSARGASLDSVGIQFNSDTTTNYSYTLIQGNTSSGATSGRGTNASDVFAGNCAASSASNNFSLITTQIMNYKSTSTFKTILSRGGGLVSAVKDTEAIVGLWRKSPEAITSITILSETGSNFNIGSTFTLYGIQAEGVSPAPKATGGAIYSDTLYYYHAFGSTGVFTPSTSISADILVVAGGGAGGGSQGGGGGAGGLLGFASQSLTATNYTVTIGAGGTGVSANYNGVPGNNGSNSTFQGLTAAVGGGGGGTAGNTTNGVGSGGSGGGRANTSGAGTGTTGQGSAGGSTGTAGAKGGGGASAVGGLGLSGGAAGGTGATFNSTVGGTAGPYSFINAMGAATGTGEFSGGNYYYAGGGAGGCDVEPGGLGGGGLSTIAGRANTGGGGGGACGNPGAGGNGGSGLIIVRYLKA